MLETMYEVASQKTNVPTNLFLGNSAFAVTTAAKQGIVNKLKEMKDIKAGIVIPVPRIIVATAAIPPSPPTSIIDPATQAPKTPKVEITFSLAINPENAATTKTQLKELS